MISVDAANKWDAVSVLLRSIIVVLVVLGSLASTLICVVSVAQDEPVRDVRAFVVTLSGFGLFIIVMLFLVNLMTADLWRRLEGVTGGSCAHLVDVRPE